MPRVRLDLSVEAARERLISGLRPLFPVSQSLASSCGLVLADTVLAPIDLPRFTNSAMDGFAVRSADIAEASEARPVRLTIVGELEAGEAWAEPVGELETVRISTGAAVPEDCDAVIPAELVSVFDGHVTISEPIERGRHVRQRGEDIRRGSDAVTAGTLLRSQEIGLLAALGIESLSTVPVPVVSIVSIGPELFPGARPAPVKDANGPMLAAQVERAGGEIVRIERCDGDLDSLFALLDELGDQSDLIVTSGGISDSTVDTMADLLEPNPDAELWNVRLRPGKHFGVGFFDDHSILSLPGNPIAAFVGFELFGGLAIDLLAGRRLDRVAHRARIAESLTGTRGRTDVLRGRAWIDANGQLWTAPTENRGSGVISTLPEANCLILLPESVERLEPGDTAEIRWVGYQ